MDAPKPSHVPAHLARPSAPKACPSCQASADAGRLVRCPRCHATHHAECVWEQSRCPCGYDLEDEARRLAVVWAERSARWLFLLPTRWAEGTREGVRAQRRFFGSLCASAAVLSAVLTAVLLVVLHVILTQAQLA